MGRDWTTLSCSCISSQSQPATSLIVAGSVLYVCVCISGPVFVPFHNHQTKRVTNRGESTTEGHFIPFLLAKTPLPGIHRNQTNITAAVSALSSVHLHPSLQYQVGGEQPKLRPTTTTVRASEPKAAQIHQPPMETLVLLPATKTPPNHHLNYHRTTPHRRGFVVSSPLAFPFLEQAGCNRRPPAPAAVEIRQKPTSESSESPNAYPTTKTTCLRKRMLNLSLVAVTLSLSIPISISEVMAQELELERYTDSKEGFTLLRPFSWVKIEKTGATVLFEEPNKAANNLGIVVNPVRLTKLEEFGSPQFVADRLIQAEKQKESTKDADIISVSERSGHGGLQVYEIEYKLDSTRGGMKRIFTAVFVASNKLYILNVAHTDKPESPLDMHRRRLLEQVLHSFDATL